MKPSCKLRTKENIFDISKNSNNIINLSLIKNTNKNHQPLQNQKQNFRYEKSPKSYQLNLYNDPQDDIPKEYKTNKDYVLTSQAFIKLERDNLQPTPNSILCSDANDGYLILINFFLI